VGGGGAGRTPSPGAPRRRRGSAGAHPAGEQGDRLVDGSRDDHLTTEHDRDEARLAALHGSLDHEPGGVILIHEEVDEEIGEAIAHTGTTSAGSTASWVGGGRGKGSAMTVRRRTDAPLLTAAEAPGVLPLPGEATVWLREGGCAGQPVVLTHDGAPAPVRS
jgi:hypothetical protein